MLYAAKVVNLPQSALKFLVQQIDSDDCLREYQTAGGLLSNLEYAWLASGPRLEVVNTKNGDKIGAWIFGSVLKDLDSEVVCVGEIARPHGRPPLLIVAVDCAINGSTICVFDFITSKVVRAVQLADKVTSLHVVDSGFEVLALPGPLRNFDGIVAIGTTFGNVYLLDVCRQACDEALTTSGLTEVRDELNSCQLSMVTPRDKSNIEMHKEHAVRAGHHLAIHLNAVYDQSIPHFTLKGPKGEDRLHVNKKEVIVSALHYCPQLGSLLVGYNFGAFQLYNLITMELIFTSPVCEEHIPISHFTLQEPADDPRAFCYIWAVYSDQFHATCLPLAVMYTCCYISKEYHEGYGYLYEDFQYCNVNYQMELGSVSAPSKNKKKIRGGNCLRLNSILRSLKGGNADMTEDNSTLCFFAWTVSFFDTTVEAYAAVFDLNQWYKAQMPGQPDPGFEFASAFMIQLCVSDSVPRRALALDVQLNKNSIQQFVGTQRLEEHFCPDSLSFGLCCLRETDVAFLQNNGVQKALLNEIEAGGPVCLIEPSEIYPKIIKLGLVPLFIDVHPDSEVSVNHQREIILGTALEHQLVGWICKCASDWANGSFYVTGCSLDLLICWAFQRAQTLKIHCDKFCVPLFDYSETRLDANTNALLNNCVRQIKHICSFYCHITKKLLMFVSNPELVEEQHNSLQMACTYYEVLQWFLNVGLLPECPLTAYPRSDEFDRINAPYPAHVLNTFYNHRRAILKIANQNEFSSTQSVLFIDNLIERECGGRMLQEQWEKDEGNGLYPPPSLQALLRTYLINDMELCYRHSVIIYVLLDLAMTLDAERYQPVITNLIKFPAVFKVSPSIIKITQAFWQLDHEDYNSAMGLLLDPMILSDDLKHWHHRVVLRTLLLHKEYNTALLYFQVRKPPVVDDEDIFTAITLYITNNMLDEAFYFEKHFTNRRDRNKFLLHLFRECNKNSKIRSIIYRTFTSKEESLFLRFLSDCKQEQTDDLIIYYHMLRLHFFEAFDYYDSMRANNLESRGLLGQDRAGFRDQIIHHMKSELPQVSRQVLDFCQTEKSNIWKSVEKPKPLSVFVHNSAENVEYKSSLIRAALAKSKQTYNLSTQRSFETEKTPFLRTPLVVNMAEKPARIVVNPRIVEVDEDGGEACGPPPAKRIKLSPRPPATPVMSTTIPAKLETPIVKRQSPNRSSGTEKFNIRTPQSILKVKKLIDDGSGIQLGFDDDMNSFEKLQYTPVTSLKSKGSQESLRSRTPSVRFKGLMSSTENDSSDLSLASDDGKQKEPSSENAEEDLFYSPEKMEDDNNEKMEDDDNEKMEDDDNEKMEDDYNDQNEDVLNSNAEIITTPVVGVPVLRPRSSTLKLGLRSSKTSIGNSSAQTSFVSLTSSSHRSSQLDAEPLQAHLDNDEKDSDKNIEDSSRVSESSVAISTEEDSRVTEPRRVFSPKARRSYKRSHSEMSQPTRSSPRLSQASLNASLATPEVSKKSSRSSLISSSSKSGANTSNITKSESSPATTTETEEPPLPKEDTPPSSPRSPRKRKSLCRQVLEYNTFTSSRLNATLDSSTKIEEQPLEEEEEEQLEETQEKKETIVESSEVILESKFKYTDAEESRRSSLVEKRTITTILPSEPIVWDSDLDSSGDFLNTFLTKSNSAFDPGSEDSDEDEESERENTMKEEQRLKEEEEQKRQKQEEQRLKEEEEQKRQKQEGKRLKEEDEQKRRVLEEQRHREEEEQKRKEEQKQREEEEQRRRDQEEQRRREEEELRRRDNQEQRRREEEELRRRNQEEQRRREDEEQKLKQQEEDEAAEEIDDDDDVELVVSEEESIPDEAVIEEEIKLTVLKPASFGTPDSPALQENEGEDEAMDVDDVYANLSGSDEDEESPVYEDISKRDPEMNVFEISDDLSYNASASIQKEITMEEESQYYDQSNALETVMEENICHISSSFDTLERNILDDANSEDEVVYERSEKEKKQKSVEEVIEISSSDDDDNVNNLTSGEDSSYSASTDSPIIFEKNVYDSEELSIGSSSSGDSCEDSERERYPEIIQIDDTVAIASSETQKSEETARETVEKSESDITSTKKGEHAIKTAKESVESTNREAIEAAKSAKPSVHVLETTKESAVSTNTEKDKSEKVAKQGTDALKVTKESVDSTNREEIKDEKMTLEVVDSTNKEKVEAAMVTKQGNDASEAIKQSVDSTNNEEFKAEKSAKPSDHVLETKKESAASINTEKDKFAKAAKQGTDALKATKESVDTTNRKEIETAKSAKPSDHVLKTTKESAVAMSTEKDTSSEVAKQSTDALKVTKGSVDSTNKEEIKDEEMAMEIVDSTNQKKGEEIKDEEVTMEIVDSTNKEQFEAAKVTKQDNDASEAMEESVHSTNTAEIEATKVTKQSHDPSKTTKENVELTREEISVAKDEEIVAADVTKTSDDALNREEVENAVGITSEKPSTQSHETRTKHKTVKDISIKEKTEKLRTIIENIKNNTVARIIDEFDDSYEDTVMDETKDETRGDVEIEVESSSKSVGAKAVETEKCEERVAEEIRKERTVETVEKSGPVRSEETTKIEVDLVENVKDATSKLEKTKKVEVVTVADVSSESEKTTKLRGVDTVEDVIMKLPETKKVDVDDTSAENIPAKSETQKGQGVLEPVVSSDEHVTGDAVIKTDDDLQTRVEKRKIQSTEPTKTDTPSSTDKRRKTMARRKTKVAEAADEAKKRIIPEEFIRGEGVPGPSGLGALKNEEGTVEDDYLGCPTPHFLKRRTTRAVSAEPENLKNFEKDDLDTPQFLKRRTTRALSAEPQQPKDSLSLTKHLPSSTTNKSQSPMVKSKTPGADPLDCETPAFLKRRTRACSAEPGQLTDSLPLKKPMPTQEFRSPKLDSKTPGVDSLETPAFLKRRTRACSAEPEQLKDSLSLKKRMSTEEFPSPKLDSKTPGVDFLETPEFLKRRVTRAFSAEKERLATPERDDLDCPTPAFLKRRRASTEETKATQPRTFRTRSASLDVDAGSSKLKPLKMEAQLPLIVEESEGNVKTEAKQKRARSTIDDYSSSRRLTRRQKELLEKSFGQTINLDQINPIVLLDKSSFKGQPDPEEKVVYESTPPGSPSSAKGPARRLRSASQVSDGSSVSEANTPTKKGSKKMTEETPPSSSRVLRSRSMSNASSNASSVSNISRTSRTSIRRKLASQELPEIKEEVDEPHPAKRKARSKK